MLVGVCGLLGNYILTISHLYKLRRKRLFRKLDYSHHDPKTKQKEVWGQLCLQDHYLSFITVNVKESGDKRSWVFCVTLHLALNKHFCKLSIDCITQQEWWHEEKYIDKEGVKNWLNHDKISGCFQKLLSATYTEQTQSCWQYVNHIA